jgi:membrane fusion protein (multidrug efflux system)
MKKGTRLLPKNFHLSTLVVLILLSACEQKKGPSAPPPAPVSFIEIKATDVALNKEMVGETAGYRDIEVRSRVNGILLKRTYVSSHTKVF